MSAAVLICGKVFDGLSDVLTGPAEILVEQNRIAEIGRSVRRPVDARMVDLSDRTVSPGFIDTPRASDDGCGQFGTANSRIISEQSSKGSRSRA